MNSPWIHHEFTVRCSPWIHCEMFTMNSPWMHHECTMNSLLSMHPHLCSPWIHHEFTVNSPCPIHYIESPWIHHWFTLKSHLSCAQTLSWSIPLLRLGPSGNTASLSQYSLGSVWVLEIIWINILVTLELHLLRLGPSLNTASPSRDNLG